MSGVRMQKKNRRALGQSLEMAQFLDSGSNKIKRRIRDLERLLKKKKDILPSNIIVEKERTLEALRLELHNHEVKENIRKNAKKYHMVRFFERKKALRRYKKALKTYKADENEANKEALENAEVDLCYVVNFPKSEKYISIFTEDDTEASAETNLRRKAFRQLVRGKIADKSLPVSLSNILAGKKLSEEAIGVTLDDALPRSNQTDASHQESDEDSDSNENEKEEDDFFE
ncbi:rRNA-processing protein Efg1 [Nakaseomyces glabratus]|nr:rRNA-processing protein Efg1 [Nakaseomyces glabratus]KAH7588689.1 rRNA-processing protein Efg1 [Nakaseomyces glabratus]KAH7593103.1 rRNA-processing protein Efg1 [Nakaseomyces glabratus]KAH7602139.1 rRNA-processing protein Efg1 [Nakaseomyces glabratus]KAH7613529.1 rRNA-processing protein Efg1 [Nakaseomyces glabratus]